MELKHKMLEKLFNELSFSLNCTSVNVFLFTINEILTKFIKRRMVIKYIKIANVTATLCITTVSITALRITILSNNGIL